MSCSRSGSSARWRRRRRDLAVEIVGVLRLIGVFGVGRFDASQSDFFNAAAWQMDFDARLSVRLHAVRSGVRLSHWGMYAPPADHDVSGVFQVVRDVDVGDAVRGGLCRLESFDFEAEAGQCVLPLLIVVLVVCEAREEVARDCETFSIDEVGW